MKKITRLLAILLSLAMLCCMTACGNSKTSSEGGSGATGGNLLEFDDETASGVASDAGNDGTGSSGGTNSTGGNSSTGGTTVDKPVTMGSSDPFANIPKRLKGSTVTFAHFGDEGADEYVKVFNAFEKKTGIKVKPVSFNQVEYVSQVAKQINAGQAPDVIICNSTFPSALEIAQPLQNIIDLNDDFWSDTITKQTTVGKNTYFVNSTQGPWMNVGCMFYNKTMFNTLGLTTPTVYYKAGQWTWETYKKLLEQITKAGYVGGTADPLVIAWSVGKPVVSYDPATATFSSNVKQLEKYIQFDRQNFKEGLWSSTDWWGTFGNGNIGLYLSDTYGLKYNGYFKNADDNMLAAVPAPTSFQGEPTKTTLSIRGYGIAKGAKNPEAAVYFLRYFLDYEYYDDAGADIFKNKNLEKLYFDELMPEIDKGNVVLEYYYNPIYIATGKSSISDENLLGKALSAEPSQVPGELAAVKNVMQNVVNKANEKIKPFK